MTPDGLDADALEAAAAHVHAQWVAAQQARGVHSRPSPDGEEQMVAYEDLSEEAKDLDRGTVRATLNALQDLGYIVTRVRTVDEILTDVRERRIPRLLALAEIRKVTGCGLREAADLLDKGGDDRGSTPNLRLAPSPQED